MAKTTQRQTGKGPGKEMINLQKDTDQAINERNKSNNRSVANANTENKPVANIKKAGRSKH
jgi:hypothetical protein